MCTNVDSDIGLALVVLLTRDLANEPKRLKKMRMMKKNYFALVVDGVSRFLLPIFGILPADHHVVLPRFDKSAANLHIVFAKLLHHYSSA